MTHAGSPQTGALHSRCAPVGLAAGISLATLVVRPAFPFGSGQVGQLKLWQWPTYLGMFGLGIIAVQRGGLDAVPDRIKRTCGQAVPLSLSALGLGCAAIKLAGYSTSVQERGLHWAPPCSPHSKGRLLSAPACGCSRSRSDI